jgi:hypothetical protein
LQRAGIGCGRFDQLAGFFQHPRGLEGVARHVRRQPLGFQPGLGGFHRAALGMQRVAQQGVGTIQARRQFQCFVHVHQRLLGMTEFQLGFGQVEAQARLPRGRVQRLHESLAGLFVAGGDHQRHAQPLQHDRVAGCARQCGAQPLDGGLGPAVLQRHVGQAALHLDAVGCQFRGAVQRGPPVPASAELQQRDAVQAHQFAGQREALARPRRDGLGIAAGALAQQVRQPVQRGLQLGARVRELVHGLQVPRCKLMTLGSSTRPPGARG